MKKLALCMYLPRKLGASIRIMNAGRETINIFWARSILGRGSVSATCSAVTCCSLVIS